MKKMVILGILSLSVTAAALAAQKEVGVRANYCDQSIGDNEQSACVAIVTEKSGSSRMQIEDSRLIILLDQSGRENSLVSKLTPMMGIAHINTSNFCPIRSVSIKRELDSVVKRASKDGMLTVAQKKLPRSYWQICKE